MASISIRNLDEALKDRLRMRAARNRRSMENEAREILRIALSEEPPSDMDLATAIQRRVRPFKGVDLELPEREEMRPPPDLSELDS
jgi:antitoxin FitA